jgi:hypothetical protein
VDPPDLRHGDLARTAAGGTVRVTRRLSGPLLLAVVLRNPSGDGRWLVGAEYVFLVDELTPVDSPATIDLSRE